MTSEGETVSGRCRWDSLQWEASITWQGNGREGNYLIPNTGPSLKPELNRAHD